MVKLDSKNQELIAVNMDHIKLSAFPTRSDPLFLKIVEVIINLLARSRSKRTQSESDLSLKIWLPVWRILRNIIVVVR